MPASATAATSFEPYSAYGPTVEITRLRVRAHLGERIGVVGIDRDAVDFGAGGGSDFGELARVAPGHRPRDVPMTPVALDQVLA